MQRFIRKLLNADGRQGGIPEEVIVTVVDHILEDNHSQPVAVIIKLFRLYFYVLPKGVKAQLLHGENIIGVYSTDEDSYGNAIYGSYAASASAPKMVVTNTGYVECSYGLSTSIQEQGSSETKRQYDSFISSGSTAVGYAYNASKEDYSYTATDPGTRALAAVVARQRLDPVDSVYTYSYVFCANSKDFFSNELLGNPAYANYDVMSAVVDNMVRTDIYASSDLGGSSMNSKSFGGKQLVSTTLLDYENYVYSPDATEVVKINKGIGAGAKTAFSILIYAVPVAIAIVGISVGIKRKFL